MSLDIGDIVYSPPYGTYGYVSDKVKTSKTKYIYVYWFNGERTAEYAIGSLVYNKLQKVQYGKPI